MDYAAVISVTVMLLVVLTQIYFLGRRMSEPEKMLKRMPEGPTTHQLQALAYYREWLASAGLEFHCAFKFGAATQVVFRHWNQPRYFTFLFHQRLTMCAETYWDDLTVLDTSNSSNGNLFPRPGAYYQNFPKAPPRDIWQRHLETEAHLTRKLGLTQTPGGPGYEETFFKAVHIRMQHNRAQPFWPVRVLYRFFVTRHRQSGRSILQQFP